MKVSFGINNRKALTGAELYVRIFQAASIVLAPYIFIASAHMKLLTSTNVFSILTDLAISSLPRVEVLLASFIYRGTRSEVIILFAVLVLALIYGLISPGLLKGSHGIQVRKILCVLIAIDLVIRLIPMGYNLAFGWPFAIAGFVIRAICLALIIMDLKASKNTDK